MDPPSSDSASIVPSTASKRPQKRPVRFRGAVGRTVKRCGDRSWSKNAKATVEHLCLELVERALESVRLLRASSTAAHPRKGLGCREIQSAFVLGFPTQLAAVLVKGGLRSFHPEEHGTSAFAASAVAYLKLKGPVGRAPKAAGAYLGWALEGYVERICLALENLGLPAKKRVDPSLVQRAIDAEGEDLLVPGDPLLTLRRGSKPKKARKSSAPTVDSSTPTLLAPSTDE